MMGFRLQIGRILSFGLAVALASTFGSSLDQKNARAQESAHNVGVDLGGRAVDPFLASRGRIVVLIFVRTDCPISNRYAPTIQRLSSEYVKQAAFWLVYPSRKESSEMIREHDEQFGYKVPAIRDPQRALVQMSQAQITPEAAVFDRNGRLTYHGRIDNWYEDFGHSRKAPTTHELDDAITAAGSGKPLLARETPAVGCYISDLE